MKVTLTIDDPLLEKAARLTANQDTTVLVRLGLEALIAGKSAGKLAKMGGTQKGLKDIPRRKGA